MKLLSDIPFLMLGIVRILSCKMHFFLFTHIVAGIDNILLCAAFGVFTPILAPFLEEKVRLYVLQLHKYKCIRYLWKF